jgi:signal peptidase II
VTKSALAARRLTYLIVSVLVVFADQATKAVVAERIPLHSSVPVIQGLFDLTHVKNAGAAFGLFATIDSPMRTVLLNAVAFIVFFAVLVYAFRTSVASTRLQVGLALILGGAVGNLVDRMRVGSVTDFLDFYVGSHRWPAFNVADSAITIGVVLLAWDIWRPHTDMDGGRGSSRPPGPPEPAQERAAEA